MYDYTNLDCTSFPAGELWDAIQPHWRWEDLPESLWWSESQVRKRRPGPPMLLCGRQDRTLTTAHTLWTGNSTQLISIFSICNPHSKFEYLMSCLPFCLVFSRFVTTPVTLLSTSPWTFWWKTGSVKEWLLSAWKMGLFTASEPRILLLLPGRLLTVCLQNWKNIYVPRQHFILLHNWVICPSFQGLWKNLF